MSSETAKSIPPKPAEWGKGIRRIVNGHDATGKAVVLSDSECELTVRQTHNYRLTALLNFCG
jgi:hypothetical protein